MSVREQEVDLAPLVHTVYSVRTTGHFQKKEERNRSLHTGTSVAWPLYMEAEAFISVVQ